MTFGHSLGVVSIIGLFVGVTVGACDSSQTTSGSCAPGTERCNCYGNDTCNSGLVCRSQICVADVIAAGGSDVEAGGTAGEGGHAGSTMGGESSTAPGGASLGGSDPGTIGLGGSSATTAPGGTTGISEGGTSTSSGGTTPIGTGGTTSIGEGGTSASSGCTTPIGSGGTTVTASGGTTVTASGGMTPIGSGGATTGVGGATGGAAALGPNQIKNGDFSGGSSYWHVTDGTGYELTIGSVSTDGAYCITSSSSAIQYTGWPVAAADAITLQPGSLYLLKFRAKASSTASISAKVGYFASPYTSVYTSTSVSLPTAWQEFSYTLPATTSTTTPAVGVVFSVVGSICLDDVVLAMMIAG